MTAGAPWLPRGAPGMRSPDRAAPLSRRARRARICRCRACPAEHQAMNAASPVAMLRHQERASCAAIRRLARRWGGRTGRRGFSSSARARSSATARSWLDGGHNPSAARQIAASPRTIRRRQAAAPDLREPRDQGPRRHARAVRAASLPRSMRADPRPRLLRARRSRRGRGELGIPADAHDDVAAGARDGSRRRAAC